MGMKIQYLIIILSTIVLISSCNKEDNDALKAVVEEEIRHLNEGVLPLELEDVYSYNDILVFGETHYVQEHQDFIVDMLPELSARGYRVIFQEPSPGYI